MPRILQAVLDYFRCGAHRRRAGKHGQRLVLRPAAPSQTPPPPTWDEIARLIPIIRSGQFVHPPNTYDGKGWLPDGAQPTPGVEPRHDLPAGRHHRFDAPPAVA